MIEEREGSLPLYLFHQGTNYASYEFLGVHATEGDAPYQYTFRVRNPIISTCAGTEEEPANCASECIRPMVSVIP